MVSHFGSFFKKNNQVGFDPALKRGFHAAAIEKDLCTDRFSGLLL